MKYISTLLVVALLLQAGCKKDEEDNTPSNYFSLDGTFHELTRGYLVAGKIYLMSDGLTVKGVEQNTGTPIYQGTGTLVSITGITGQPGIASGNFDLQLVEGDLYINWDPALTTFDYNASLSMSTGTCAISLNGLSCSVRIDGTSTQDGKTQKVRFSGDLSEVSK